MAEKIALDLEVNSSGKGVGELKQSLAEAKESAAQIKKEFGASSAEAVKAANKVEDLNSELKIASNNTGNLKQQLKQATLDAQNLAIKFGASSAEAVKAAQRVANLKEEISDVKDTVDALHPEAKFNAIVKVGQGIAGGFAAAQGAMALFGSESEDVQKALLKVQAAMALSQGLNEIKGLQDGFSNLSIVIKNSTLYTKAAAAMQAAYNFVVGASTGALKLLRLAMAATGIGALIVGLGLLIVNFDKITGFVQKNADTLIKWGKIILGVLFPPIGLIFLLWSGVQKLGEKFEIIGVVTAKIGEKFAFLKNKIVELLETIGILSTTEEKNAEARMEQSKGREAAIKKEIELAKAQGASATELAALEVKLARERFLAVDQLYKARFAAGRDITKEEKEQYEELSLALKIAKLQEQKVIEDANAKQLEENKKKWAAKKAADQKAAEESLKLQNDLQDLVIANIENNRTRELLQIQTTFERKIAAIKGNSVTEIEIRKQLAIAQATAVKEIDAKFEAEATATYLQGVKKRFDDKNALLEAQKIEAELKGQETAEIEKAQALLEYNEALLQEDLSREQKLLLLAKFHQKVADADKKEADKKKAEEKALAAVRMQMAQDVLSSLSSLADLGIKNEKKNAAAKKAIALVQIGIDTAVSIAKAVRNAQDVGFPASIPVTLTTVAMVLANVAKARKLLGGGGGGGGDTGGAVGASTSGGGGGAEPQGVVAPRLTSTDSPRTQLTSQEKLSVTVQAQVVETDMTISQKRVSSIKDAATF